MAFSGRATVKTVEYTEFGINKIKEEELRFEFDRSCYQVLIVANKYQTGFDQPKLVAMYVDKKLKGVAAVQTLSRLNRIYPPYNKSTFILDFKNDYEVIKKAFAPYYKDTILFETVSPSDIREIDQKLDSYNFLITDDVEKFNEYLYQERRSAKDKQNMWVLLDSAVKKISCKTEQEQISVLKTIRKFIKGYGFLIQSTAYEDIELHKRYNFLTYLINEIHISGGGNNFDIADKITVSNFRQEKIDEHTHTGLNSNPRVTIKKPKPVTVEEEQRKRLSQIIEELNTLYDKHYGVNFATKAALQIRDLLLETADLKEQLTKSAKNNTLQDFQFSYDECIMNALVDGYEQNKDFYGLLLDNREVRKKISDIFLTEIYHVLRGDQI